MTTHYLDVKRLKKECVPEGFYWVRDPAHNSEWTVGAVRYYFTMTDSSPRVFLDVCGWGSGWVGPIELGPRIVQPEGLPR